MANNQTLRILHNLPRSGGTLVSRCIACMNEVALLSEIHPRGIKFYNPVSQAIAWYKLFSEKDIADFSSRGAISFDKAIELINTRFCERNLSLVLRDWAHLDFIGVPFIQKPSGHSELVDILAHKFSINRIYLVRHPVDIWQSLIRDPRLKAAISLEQFLSAYVQYAQLAAAGHIIRYEDFTRNPHAQLKSACDALDLVFDPAFTRNWHNYKKITGDPRSFTRTTITPGKSREIPTELQSRLGSSSLYHEAVSLLNYTTRL